MIGCPRHGVLARYVRAVHARRAVWHSVFQVLLHSLLILALWLPPILPLLDIQPAWAQPQTENSARPEAPVARPTMDLPPELDAPARAPDAAGSVPGESGSAPGLEGFVELVNERGEFSRRFRGADGSLAVVQSGEPLHYWADAARWEPVNPGFAPVAGGWVDRHNTLQTSLAERVSYARLTNGELGIGWEPQSLRVVDVQGQVLGELATPNAEPENSGTGQMQDDGRTLAYVQSWSAANVEDRWTVGPGKAAYTMVLNERPVHEAARLDSADAGDWLELRVIIHMRPGTSLRVGTPGDLRHTPLPLDTDAGLAFIGPGGEQLYLHPPTVYEAADGSLRAPGRYAVETGPAPNSLVLAVRYPWNWLADATRAYPVVLDPVFQTISAITLREAWYTPGMAFDRNYPAPDPWIGTFGNGTARTLLHFAMPTMPPGTQIDRAFVVAAPTATIGNDDFFDAPVELFALADGSWRTNTATPPASTGGPLPIFTGAPMRFSRGAPLKLPTVWDVTTLASTWFSNPASNHGLMLKMAQECATCNGFGFVYPSQFSDEELALTQSSNAAQNRLLTFSANSGIRLVTFYRAAALGAGARQTASPPSPDLRYYQADHVYTLPALPVQWQVVAVRGLTMHETEGGDPETRINHTPPHLVVPQGSTGVAEVTSAEDPAASIAATDLAKPFNLTTVQSSVYVGLLTDLGDVDYTVLNGRGFPGTALEARVDALVGDAADQADFYDIQLIGESPTALNVTEFGPTTFEVSIDLMQPATIWNMNLPVNSNNRVDFLSGDGFIASRFSAQLFPGNTQAVLAKGNGAQSIRFEHDGSFRISSALFPARTQNHGLVLVNRTGLSPEGPGEDDTPTAMVQIRITSCEAGSFPSGGGECIKVECPTAAFPASNFRSNVGLGVWSATGWTQPPNSTSQFTVPGAVAPLIGGPTMSNTPTVAVIGGGVMTVANSFIEIQEESLAYRPDVLLIQCTAGSSSFTDYVQAFRGKMSTAQHPNGQTILRSPAAFAGLFYTPWLDVERFNLSESHFVGPIPGRMGGYGTVDRIIGPSAAANKVTFHFDWSIGPQGWSTLQSSVTRGATGTIPAVASLSLDLGSVFAFDFQPQQQKFVALRGRAARITQPASLGGASKPVQVLIFPSSLPIPTSPLRPCGYNNCLDVRHVADTLAAPNRVWDMPDIHVTGEAGMMAIAANGSLQVYSRDFPDELRRGPSPGSRDALLAAAVQSPAHSDNFDANFSYDSFGAKVVVRTGRCVATDTVDVDIIEGATYVSLPGIGGDTGEARIASTFKLCQSTMRQVHLEFRSPVGVPLGNSGLFLTGLQGTVDIYPGHTTITLGIDIQAAAGGGGGLLKMHGSVTIDTRGLFAFQGQGSVLKGIMGVDGALWVAWSPLDIGFRVSLGYPVKNPWITGMLRAHMWQGQGFANRYSWLPDNDEVHIAAQASVTIFIREGAIFSWWFIDIPPFNIHLGIEIAFGQFCRNSSCTDYEWGIKGKLTIVGYDIGMYYTFGRDLSSPEVNPANLSFILGNDDHVLIDQYNGATDIPIGAGIAGLRPEGLDAMDAVVTVHRSPNRIGAAEHTIPLSIKSSSEQLLFALGWQAGAPVLSLRMPNGTEITQANAESHGAQFYVGANSVLVSVQEPAAGQWQAVIRNLSENGIEHYQFTYFASKGAPIGATENLLLTPAEPQENGDANYRITWRVPDSAPPTAKIQLSATRVDAETLGNTGEAVPIVQNLPLSQGFYDWDLRALPFGEYAVSAQIEDGINDVPAARTEDLCDENYQPLPTMRAFDPARFAITHVFTATGTIIPNAPNMPSTPANLTVTPQDGALLVRWDAVPETTVVGYRLDLYWLQGQTRSQTVVASKSPAARLGALENGVLYEVYVTALDVTGNSSLVAAVGAGTPDAEAEPVYPGPTDVTVTPTGPGTVQVSWTPVPGGPVAYRVHYIAAGSLAEDGSESGMAESAASPVTLTGLTTGQAYDIQVGSVNSAGWEGLRSGAVRVLVTQGTDANGDGLADDWAARYGLPAGSGNLDSDGDGLTNAEEQEAGTHPLLQDSDGDGFSDWEEVQAETDPLDAREYPALQTQPRLTLDEDRLRLRVKLQTAGEIAPSATISWTNSGGGTLNLQAGSNAGWLQATVQQDVVLIQTQPELVAPGYHVGVVRLEPAGNSDPLIGAQPQGAACIRVELWASPPDEGFVHQLHLPTLAR